MPRKIDLNRFFVEDPSNPIETMAEKRARIRAAQQNVDAIRGAIDAGVNTNGRERATLSRIHQRMKALSSDLSMRDLMAGLGSIPQINTRDLLLPEDRMLLAQGNPVQSRQVLTEEFPTAHDNWIIEDLDNTPQPKPPQRRSLRDDIAGKINPSKTNGNWVVKQYLGETRGGSKVHVWKVENTHTHNKLETLFRVESVANRIVLLLNESGNINDSRVLSLINCYNRRDKLLKEARALQKSAEGKTMKSERLRAIQSEINQLDFRLGIQ